MSEQWVYALKNPSYKQGVVKVGSTTDVNERMNKLMSVSGVPEAFELIVAIQVKGSAEFVEKKRFHKMIVWAGFRRINPLREFFEIPEDKIMEMFRNEPHIAIRYGKDDVPKKPTATGKWTAAFQNDEKLTYQKEVADFNKNTMQLEYKGKTFVTPSAFMVYTDNVVLGGSLHSGKYSLSYVLYADGTTKRLDKVLKSI